MRLAVVGGLVSLTFVIGCFRNALPPKPSASPSTHSLADRPVRLVDDRLVSAERAMQPLIGESRAELPSVRTRFRKGLPEGSILYVTVRFPIPDGAWEQAFVAVKAWDADRIQGILASELRNLHDPVVGDSLEVLEHAVLDWTIVGRDGREEGNRLGHFLESLHQVGQTRAAQQGDEADEVRAGKTSVDTQNRGGLIRSTQQNGRIPRMVSSSRASVEAGC